MNSPSLDAHLERIRTETRKGNHVEARRLCGQRLSEEPAHVVCLMMLGILGALRNNQDGAARWFRRALATDPQNGRAWDNFGRFLCSANRLRQGTVALTKAYLLAGLEPVGLVLLAKCFTRLRMGIQTPHTRITLLKFYNRAFQQDPTLKAAEWAGYVEILKAKVDPADGPGVLADLSSLLSDGWAWPSELVPIISSVLDRQGTWRAIANAVVPNEARPAALRVLCRELAANRLLMTALAAATIGHLNIESALTALRRALTEATAADPGLLSDALAAPAIVGLALQCALNEYVYFETEGEVAAVDRIVAQLADEPSPAEGALALIAAYRPDAFRAIVRSHAPAQPSPAMRTLLRRLIEEPEAERQIGETIQTLTKIDNPVSHAVKRQYEENPYPRWQSALTRCEPLAPRATLASIVPAFHLEGAPEQTYEDFLVAGCGTGRDVIELAARFPKARILALDLSRASLAYAKRKATEAGFDRIRFHQADILELGGFAERFDLVQSSGVLHHTADPAKGLEILRNLVRPGGLMYIGLYSRIGREYLAPVQTYIKREGIGADAASIRRFRHAFIHGQLPELKRPSDEWGDFFTTTGCRDLLFHAQEVTFDLAEIEALLRSNRLRFLGFSLPNASMMNLFHRQFPARRSVLSLENWRLFEERNRLCFAGMYQFWAMAA